MKDMLYSLTIDSDGDGIPDFLDKDKDTATSKLSEDLYNIGAFMHEHTALWKKFEIQGLAGIIDMATKLIDAVARYAVAGKPPSEQGGDSSSGGNSGKEDEDNPFSSKKTGD
jgi:hypothetical protein